MLVGKPEGKRPLLENLGIYGSIILKWILELYGGYMRTGFMGLRIGSSGGPL
jgi:hypothetical protein